VVAGVPGPQLADVVERVWRQVPAPRALVEIPDATAADADLAAGAALLTEIAHQRATAPDAAVGERQESSHGHDHEAGVPAEAHSGREHIGHDEHSHDEHSHGGHGPAAPAAGGHESASHEHSGHDHGGGHGDHGGHHMHHGGVVAGLPMADLGEDRDGLALDRLHVPLGPVLPEWPAGLVLHLTLQGDVVQEATAQVLDAVADAPVDGLVRELDALARFLGVAGWGAVAAGARRLRDDLVEGVAAPDVADQVTALVRRVRRSRTLRWQLRRLPAGGTDVAALLARRLAAVEAVSAGREVAQRPSAADVAPLLVGAELAAARLVVAALDPEPVPAGVSRV
jgi:hypothetical protein